MKKARGVSCVLVVLAAAACGPVGRNDSGASGGSGGAGGSAGTGGAPGGSGSGGSTGTGGYGGGTGGAGGMTCTEESKLVYLVDANKHLLSFLPATLAFTDLGQLNCPAQHDCPGPNNTRLPATPFSMSLDRDAKAWILYCSGELFKVDVTTRPLACEATTFAINQQSFEVFGMGYVADQPGSSAETLYIAGGRAVDESIGQANLGRIAMPGLAVSRIGAVSGWPELTGTGDAQLWAFAPTMGNTPPAISQLNKTTGSPLTGPTFDLSAAAGFPESWAFAFWGDKFWIFLKRLAMDQSTVVYVVPRAGGAAQVVIPASGHQIVGAGVSTCAPIVSIEH
jgi:hypothetical protein